MRITDAYRELNRDLHQTNDGYGVSGKKWAGIVQQIYQEVEAQSVLDYGCGKQTLSKALPHMMMENYDPCIEGLDTPPQPADLVICGDVLEHVEEECIDDVLKDLRRLTNKALFVVVAMRPAKKILADGRNAHILQRPNKWWINEFWRHDFQLRSLQDNGGEFTAVWL